MEKKDSYHHKDLKNALVREATRRLDADPDADLSLRGMARDLGVSAMAPYAHFSNKHELLEAVALLGHEIMLKQVKTVAMERSGLEDKLFAFGKTYLIYHREHPGLFHLMFEQPRRPDGSPVRLAAEKLVAVASEAILEETELPDEAAVFQLIDLMVATVHGIALFSHRSLLRSLDNSGADPLDLVRLAAEGIAARVRELTV